MIQTYDSDSSRVPAMLQVGCNMVQPSQETDGSIQICRSFPSPKNGKLEKSSFHNSIRDSKGGGWSIGVYKSIKIILEKNYIIQSSLSLCSPVTLVFLDQNRWLCSEVPGSLESYSGSPFGEVHQNAGFNALQILYGVFQRGLFGRLHSDITHPHTEKYLGACSKKVWGCRQDK